MKRILLALTMVGFVLSLAPRVQADTEVSLNFFYDNLSDQGNWIEAGDYGYCFQPTVAVNNPDWRPYADGYWAYTDSGWTWVSYEDFGWATYHYGRWANLDSYGWVWVPGNEWGPAWVSWRTGGDYVGWAPLPPQPVGVVYEGEAITDAADVTFGIGPLYYNFVDIRYIGEPVLATRILAPSRNLTIINQTVNVTNITYNNSAVCNYGPDYNRLNQYSARPIQRLKLQREGTVGTGFGQNGRRGNFNRVNGNELMVVAPRIQKSPQPIAPKRVTARVQTLQVERGWRGVTDRQRVEAQMKNQSRRDVPPPDFQPQKGRKEEAVATGAPNAVREGNARKAVNAGRGQRVDQSWQPNVSAMPESAQQAVEQKNENRGLDRAQQGKEGRNRLDEQRRQQQAQRVEQANRAQQAQQVQQAQRAIRAEQAQQAQEARRAEQARRLQEARQPRPAPQPEQAQRLQQVRPPAPPVNRNPNAATEVKKKKKPGDEQPPPQP